MKPGIHTFVSHENPGMSRYLPCPVAGEVVTFGTGYVVSAAKEEVVQALAGYLQDHPYPHSFATPSILKLGAVLTPFGLQPAWQGEYFLPDIDRIPDLSCAYHTRLLTPPDFADLYLPEWGNALCASRPELDMVGVGTYDGDKLVAFAACSADCPDMWQIGVDVLPAYRRKGLASFVTAQLTKEILKRGKVPFYCAAWSNLGSVRNALRCGYRPAWVRLSCIPL